MRKLLLISLTALTGLAIAAEDRFAFKNVGMAIVVNTVILAIGFFVQTGSAFKPNFDMGLMTILAIVFALILDFLLLPSLLMIGGKKQEQPVEDAVPAPSTV